MLESVRIEDVLFLDIETVPGTPDFESLSEPMQHLWGKKSEYFRKEHETPADAYERAGIYAEFGKIVCISVGVVTLRDGIRKCHLKSFASHNEYELLTQFAGMLNKFTESRKDGNLCGHNLKEFDAPYIARRMLIHGIKLPIMLDVAGRKPWEVKFLDTLELWKFGDYKHYTSLNLLTAVFQIPSPKDDIDGSQVAGVYYREGDLQRIANYCEKDVLATVQLFLRYRGEALIAHVEHIS